MVFRPSLGVSSLLAYPADSGVASIHQHVSQFLIITHSHTHTHTHTHTHPVGSVSLENPNRPPQVCMGHMTNPSQQNMRKMKCVVPAMRYFIILCFSTLSSPPVAYLETTRGQCPHVGHKVEKALRMVQQRMSALDFMCMRNYYCVKAAESQGSFATAAGTKRSIFYHVHIGQKEESSALFGAQKKKAAPDTWKLS